MSNDNILLPSNKKFGIVMRFVAISFGGFVVFHQIQLIGYVLLLVGFLLILGALKNPEWLSPLNRAWRANSMQSHRCVQVLYGYRPRRVGRRKLFFEKR